MTRSYQRAAAVALALLMLALAACAGGGGGRTSEAGLTKLTYSSFDGPGGLPAKFGQEKGFFKEAGLDVEFVKAEDPVAIVSSGDADLGDSDTTSALIAAGKGAPIRIVSSMYRSKGPFYLIARPEIRSIQDLKGKQVGIGRKGSGMEVYTKVILQKEGFKPDDVTYVPNGSYEAAYASLQSGQVDATIIHEPFVSLAEAEGKGRLLAKGWDYLPTFHTGVEIANTRFTKENPEAVRKFLAAYLKSAVYAKQHQDEFAAYAVKQTGIDPKVEAKSLERGDPIWDNQLGVDLEALRDTQQIQRDLGFQNTFYEPKDLVDTSFLPKQE